jgi:ABC-type bacteriocin/lantibiotic exporter with double-glycine peptidase domain
MSADPTFSSKPRSTREVVRRVAVYLAPYQMLAVATVGCAVLSLAAGMAYPLLTKIILNNVIKENRADLLTMAALGLLVAFLLRETFNTVASASTTGWNRMSSSTCAARFMRGCNVCPSAGSISAVRRPHYGD